MKILCSEVFYTRDDLTEFVNNYNVKVSNIIWRNDCYVLFYFC